MTKTGPCGILMGKLMGLGNTENVQEIYLKLLTKKNMGWRCGAEEIVQKFCDPFDRVARPVTLPSTTSRDGSGCRGSAAPQACRGPAECGPTATALSS